MCDREKLKSQQNYMRLIFATRYQRFKQKIYMMLNYALIQVIGYLKQLALRVYIVHCLSQTKHMIINKRKMRPALRGKMRLGDVICNVVRNMRLGDVIMITMIITA